MERQECAWYCEITHLMLAVHTPPSTPPPHTHAQGIALLFHYLIISCSNNQNKKRAAKDTCPSWVHNACNKYACKSLSILILNQPCSATGCNWWFINKFSLIPSNLALHRTACGEKHSVTLCPPLTLCHCSGSPSGQTNRTCSIIQALDRSAGTHVSHSMRKRTTLNSSQALTAHHQPPTGNEPKWPDMSRER